MSLCRRVFLMCAALMLTAGPGMAGEKASTYGDGVDGGEVVGIAELLKDPESYEGKDVKVSGQITDVCPKKGCWMELRGATDEGLRVKVEDDVIVFPQDSKGKTAVARGIVEIKEMDRAQYLGWMQHLAEERGETFDEKDLGDGPYRIVQLAGTGAEISD